MSESREYVCRDCGADLLQDGFISAACDGCGGFNPQTRQDYENAPNPRDYAALSGDGEFIIGDEENPNAWVCADVEESDLGIMEVRE